MTTDTTSMLTPPVSNRDHAQGSPKALITLVEYGDFQCPHCGRAFPVVEQLRGEMGDRMRFVFRHFPLTNAHEHAQIAAEAAEAAAAQGHFWEMHQLLFTHQTALDASQLVLYAGQLKLDVERFESSLSDHTYRNRVREDVVSGARSGVNGTPTFFINSLRYDGPADYSALLKTMDEVADSVL